MSGAERRKKSGPKAKVRNATSDVICGRNSNGGAQIAFGMYQEASRQRDEAVAMLAELAVAMMPLAAYARTIPASVKEHFRVLHQRTGESVTVADMRKLAVSMRLIEVRYRNAVRKRRANLKLVAKIPHA